MTSLVKMEIPSPTMILINMPTEILIHILQYVGNDLKRVCRLVCHRWNSVLPTRDKDLECSNLTIVAATLGNIKLLQWAYGMNYPLDKYKIYWRAARVGCLGILEWTHEHTFDTPIDGYTFVCSQAARFGHLELLAWLRDPNTGGGRCRWDTCVCNAAVLNGHLRVIMWLRDPKTGGGVCPWSKTACRLAVGTGRLDILSWLRDSETGGGRCPWDRNVCLQAARIGRLDILIRLRDPEFDGGVCPYNQYQCINDAAANDHIHVIEWLRDANTDIGRCEWDEQTFANAVRYGSIDTLEWLRDPKTAGGICPWNESACLASVCTGRFNNLKWLRDPETGGGICPWDVEDCLAHTRNPEIIAWINHNM